MTVHRFGMDDDEETTPLSSKELSDEIDRADQVQPDMPSLFEEFRQTLAQVAQDEDTEIEIPIKASNRKHFGVIYETNIPYDRLQRWITNCTNRKTNVMDQRRFSLTIMVAMQVGITYKGERMTNPDNGNDLKFGDPYLQKLTKRLDKIGVITWLYGEGNDGEILQVGSKIAEAAGYGELDFDSDEDDDDPLASGNA